MSSFTTRVELHDADGDDYEALHKEMARSGFKRTITTSDKGSTYHLPTAEYDINGNFTRSEVREKAKTAAARMKKKFAVLVTESAGRAWYGLEED